MDDRDRNRLLEDPDQIPLSKQMGRPSILEVYTPEDDRYTDSRNNPDPHAPISYPGKYPRIRLGSNLQRGSSRVTGEGSFQVQRGSVSYVIG